MPIPDRATIMGSIHHFSNGLMSRWGAAIVGAGVWYSAPASLSAAAGGLSAFASAFFVASSGAVASQLTRKYERAVNATNAAALRREGLVSILVLSLMAGLSTAQDYEAYQKIKEREAAAKAGNHQGSTNRAP